jgi:hypothetical protein
MTTALAIPRLTKKYLDPTHDRSHLSPEQLWIEDRRFHLQTNGVGWRFKVAKHYAKRPAGEPLVSIDQACRDLIAILRQRAFKPDDLSGLTAGQRVFAEHYDLAFQFRKTQALRNAIDVLLLSGMSDDEIAKLMSCDPQTVSVYTHTFFDVRWFLNAIDAIAIHVFLNAAIDQPERAALLKCAYRGGPGAALMCVDFLAHYHEDHDLATEQGRRRHRIAQHVLLECAEQLAIDSTKQQLLADHSVQSLTRHRNRSCLADLLTQRFSVIDQTFKPMLPAAQGVFSVVPGHALVA